MKKSIAIALAVVTIASSNMVVFASDNYVNVPEVQIEEDSVITPFAEQTEYHYRILDGQLQRRLWSITYGRWIGEWEDIN